MRRRRVEHGLLRQEQAQFERRLVRMLHREPAIVPVARVGVDLEAQLAHVEVERLVLIVHIKTDYSDTFGHFGTSFSSGSVLSPASRRRFSETAILRSGLQAALTKQCGTWSSRWALACSRVRSSLGLSPVTSRNTRPKVPRLFQPVWNAISMMGASVSRSSALARSMRRVSR